MPKINNILWFLTHFTNLGLEKMPASVCMLEEKPRPNFNGMVVHDSVS